MLGVETYIQKSCVRFPCETETELISQTRKTATMKIGHTYIYILELDLRRSKVLEAVIIVVAYPFLAISGMTCHNELHELVSPGCIVTHYSHESKL